MSSSGWASPPTPTHIPTRTPHTHAPCGARPITHACHRAQQQQQQHAALPGAVQGRAIGAFDLSAGEAALALAWRWCHHLLLNAVFTRQEPCSHTAGAGVCIIRARAQDEPSNVTAGCLQAPDRALERAKESELTTAEIAPELEPIDDGE